MVALPASFAIHAAPGVARAYHAMSNADSEWRRSLRDVRVTESNHAAGVAGVAGAAGSAVIAALPPRALRPGSSHTHGESVGLARVASARSLASQQLSAMSGASTESIGHHTHRTDRTDRAERAERQEQTGPVAMQREQTTQQANASATGTAGATARFTIRRHARDIATPALRTESDSESAQDTSARSGAPRWLASAPAIAAQVVREFEPVGVQRAAVLASETVAATAEAPDNVESEPHVTVHAEPDPSNEDQQQQQRRSTNVSNNALEHLAREYTPEPPVRRDLFTSRTNVASLDTSPAGGNNERSFSGISSPSSGPNTPRRLSVSMQIDSDPEIIQHSNSINASQSPNPDANSNSSAQSASHPGLGVPPVVGVVANASEPESRSVAEPPALQRQHANAFELSQRNNQTSIAIESQHDVSALITPRPQASAAQAQAPAAPTRVTRSVNAATSLFVPSLGLNLAIVSPIPQRSTSTSSSNNSSVQEDMDPHHDPEVQQKRLRDRDTIREILECCICKELRLEQLIEYPCGQHTSCLACAIQSNTVNEPRHQNIPISHFAHALPETVSEVHNFKCFACRSSLSPYCFTDAVRFVDASMCKLLAQSLCIKVFHCWGCNIAFTSFEEARRHIVQCWPSWWPCMACDSSRRPCFATKLRNSRQHSMYECRTYSCAQCLHNEPRGQCVDRPLDTVLRHLRSGQSHSPPRQVFVPFVSRVSRAQ